MDIIEIFGVRLNLEETKIQLLLDTEKKGVKNASVDVQGRGSHTIAGFEVNTAVTLRSGCLLSIISAWPLRESLHP